MRSSAGAWQVRRPNQRPAAIQHGLEVRFEGPVRELLLAAKTVTLLTFKGAEVVVGEVRELETGGWAGKVLKVLDDPTSPALGEPVEFLEGQVQGGTW